MDLNVFGHKILADPITYSDLQLFLGPTDFSGPKNFEELDFLGTEIFSDFIFLRQKRRENEEKERVWPSSAPVYSKV